LGAGLTGDLSFVNEGGQDALQVDGFITNQSSHNITFGAPMIAGASATYSGGTTGGTLNFGVSLNIHSFNVTTTGTVNFNPGNLISDTNAGTLTIGDGTITSTTILSSDNPGFSGNVAIAANGTLQLGAGSGTGNLGTAISLVD